MQNKEPSVSKVESTKQEVNNVPAVVSQQEVNITPAVAPSKVDYATELFNLLSMDNFGDDTLKTSSHDNSSIVMRCMFLTILMLSNQLMVTLMSSLSVLSLCLLSAERC